MTAAPLRRGVVPLLALAAALGLVGACAGGSGAPADAGSAGDGADADVGPADARDAAAAADHGGPEGDVLPGPDAPGGADTPTDAGDAAGPPRDAGADADDGASPPDAGAPAGCLPAALHGPLTFADPARGVRLYEGCEPGTLLVERDGARVVTDPDGVRALRGLHDYDELQQIPGVVGLGIQRCCESADPDARCVNLDFQTHRSAPEELARRLGDLFADAGDACFGFRVEWLGLLAPRCPNDAPGCEPQPYCETTDAECCVVAPAWDPAGARQPVAERYPEVAGYEGGACGGDGDCFRNGCGNHCHAWTVPGVLATCECLLALPGAFCGCVEGACRWFAQD